MMKVVRPNKVERIVKRHAWWSRLERQQLYYEAELKRYPVELALFKAGKAVFEAHEAVGNRVSWKDWYLRDIFRPTRPREPYPEEPYPA